MSEIIQFISLELKDKSSAEAWKNMSDKINESLKKADGFIYRDSATGEDGKVYCILKWESQEKVDAFQKLMQADEFKNEMNEFSEIVDMQTMKSETLKVV